MDRRFWASRRNGRSYGAEKLATPPETARDPQSLVVFTPGPIKGIELSPLISIKNQSMYVQYGCGFSAPSNWTNFDSSPTLRFERLPVVGRLYTKNADRFPTNVRYGDVVLGLPINSNTCDGVYASHVLEHLSRQDIDKALAETFRMLKPGGLFRLVVPDLERAAREYISRVDAGCSTSADRFVWDGTMLGRREKSRNLLGILYEGLATYPHLWMWDFNSLAHLLQQHGFVGIRRASFNDCGDKAFLDVEERDRFDGALAIEAQKPAAKLNVSAFRGQLDSRNGS